ncbi:MAG: TIR domain-containing protein [Candidatus Sulfotelmatobacter sp.]
MKVLSTTDGEVITFYSYKGGSGRSMALANVACLLADLEQRSTQRRVLAIDWDLEAPGLHRFFQPYLSQTELDVDGQLGLIDLFVDVARRTADIPASLEPPPDASWLGDLDFESYIMRSMIPGLEVMKAGRVGTEYTKTITTFDWAGLYTRAPWIFSWFTNELTHRYRYTLIDSRTGETDTSSICTSIMPEKLVAVFTPNLQAIQGVIRQIERAVQFRRTAADERPIKIIPVPSRIENARSALRDHWRFDRPVGFQPRFEQLFRDLFGLTTCDLTSYFAKVQIPQMPDYAFGEPIAVREEKARDRFTLSGSYVDLQAYLIDDEEIWERLSDSPAPIVVAESSRSGIELRLFRIFISYTPEDFPIAEAVGSCLKATLGDVFAEVSLDKVLLQPDRAFKAQIETKLEKTDVFIVVFTRSGNESHGYTGWEVGYFDRLVGNTPGRRKIAFFMDEQPATSVNEQGIALGLGRELLEMSYEKFESQLEVRPDEPICSLLEEWRAQVDRIREENGFPKMPRRPEQEPVACVRNLKLAIFRYLTGTIEAVLKPQRQIIVRVKGSDLDRASEDLPPDTEITPSTGTTMAIFGLPDMPITWGRFLAAAAGSPLCDSWREAITSVVLSSFSDRVDVDSSQIIFSNDEARTYRLMLTTAARYYNGDREFNIYFVEVLKQADYGDQSTSYLLKGLDVVCRFRWLFLENYSEFSGPNILVTPIERLPELAKRLLKELNLYRKDSRDAGLDQPKIWRQFLSWEAMMSMSVAFRPIELKIREIVARIAASKASESHLTTLQEELAALLGELDGAMRPVTTLLVHEMARKLESTVEGQ